VHGEFPVPAQTLEKCAPRRVTQGLENYRWVRAHCILLHQLRELGVDFRKERLTETREVGLRKIDHAADGELYKGLRQRLVVGTPARRGGVGCLDMTDGGR